MADHFSKESQTTQDAAGGPSSSIQPPHSEIAKSISDNRHIASNTTFELQQPRDCIVGARNVFKDCPITITNKCCHPQGQQKDTDVSPSTIQEKELKLQQILEVRAREISGTMSLPIKLDLAINFEQLELKHGVQRSFPELDEEGHYNKRKDFENIVKRTCKGDINLSDVFNCAMQQAKQSAIYATKNAKAQKAYVNRFGNIIALIGQAGIGKTTISKKIVQLVLDCQVLPHNQYIFFIPFREVDFLTESTLFQFLMTGCAWEHSLEADKHWKDKLNTNPNVLFVFEGLDEANTDELYRFVPPDHSALCKPDTFIRQIFRGEIFPLSKKIVSSRPRQFFELETSCRPKFAIDILGLNQKAQEKLGMQICQDKYAKVKDFLNDHPDVLASCFVPAKCIIIHGVLVMSMKADGNITIRSLTDIFVEALRHFIRSDHLRGNAKEIWKLAPFAWKGFIQKKIIFTQEDFATVKININTLQSFLCTTTESNINFSILDGDKKCSFSHLIWQELFAAINALFVLSENEFLQYLDELSKPLWEVVSKFMFGLTHPSVMTKVKRLLPSEILLDFDVKKEKLYQTLITLMEQENNSHNSVFLFQVCSWVQEADDPELTAKVANLLPKDIHMLKSMLPTDVSSIIHVLRSRKEPFSVHVVEVEFHQDGLQRWLKGFSSLQEKVEKLVFRDISIDGDSIESLASATANVKELHLIKCRWSYYAMEILFTGIASRPQPIKEFIFSPMTIGDDATMSLAGAIANIEELGLIGCRLSSHAINTIAGHISSLSQPMKLLNLSNVPINDDAALCLANAIPNINELDLEGCKLTSHAISTIAGHISSLSQPMEMLNLSRNFINDHAAASLANALVQLKSLNLTMCRLSDHGQAIISRRLSSLPQPEPIVSFPASDWNLM